MMKIKLTDIKDRTEWEYLDQNPDFADQLVATLNQVDGFSANGLEFYADGDYWTYDYCFSPHYEIDKDTFVIFNNQIQIRSTNRDDLLNLKHYQQLSDLANKDPIEWQWWIYFAQDQVLQLTQYYQHCLNIKLTKPIDQYDQKQINVMGKFMTNARDLIIKDFKLDWEQFGEQWKQGFDDVKDIGIVFDLNDFTNPKILLRWWDENDSYQYENDLLKEMLNDNSPLLKFLNNNDFQTHFQATQVKAKKLDLIKINNLSY